MGADASKLQKKNLPESQKGLLQTLMKGFSGKRQFTPLPIPRIVDLEYILVNRPNPINNISNKSQQNNNLAIKNIASLILNYNSQTWNFGNKNIIGGADVKNNFFPLMSEDTYKKFLIYVKEKLESKKLKKNTSVKSPNPSDFPIEVTNIIEEINKISINKVDDFFTVKLSTLFPEIKSFDDKKDIINITLLGLSAIIGAEHLVIYFLMFGAKPNITYYSENQDTGTLMLSYQIAISKINISKKYFIILARLIYILFLLGTTGGGIDLCNIYKLNYEIFKKNQGYTDSQESILHQLVKMPYTNINLSDNTSLINLTLQNGASIPLLLKILEKNNLSNGEKYLKLFSNIDCRDIPFGYTILYNLLLNNTIEGRIKLSLVYYLIKVGANPLIIPNIRQNSRIEQSIFVKENQTEIQLLFALLQDSNIEILKDLLTILSLNPGFDQLYKKFKISKPGLNLNKDYTIQQLYKNNQRLRGILKEVSRQKAIQTKSAIVESELLGKVLQNNTLKMLRNNPKKNNSQKNIITLSTQSEVKQQIGTIQPATTQSAATQSAATQSASLQSAAIQPVAIQPAATQSAATQSAAAKTVATQLATAQPAAAQLPVAKSPVTQLTAAQLTAAQSPATQLVARQLKIPYSGGAKKVNNRLFYLIINNNFLSSPFKAERPIIAAYSAYEFLKSYNKISKKNIKFMLYDIINNKKYKYIAKTLNNGNSIIKSYK